MAGLEMIDYAKKKGVKYVYLQFTDLRGGLRTVAITIEQLQNYVEEGTGVDGSSIEGFSNIENSDLVLFPIPSTFIQLPWNEKVARIVCEIKKPNGEYFEGDSRHILNCFLEKIRKEFGYEYFVGPELEFFLLNGKEPSDTAYYYATFPLDKYAEFRLEIGDLIEYFGLIPEYFHHEVAPGQHEINFRFNNALLTADGVQIYKFVARYLASKYDLIATFMPKPFANENGSGMHVHQSLFNTKTGENVFADDNALSEIGLHYVAGLLKYSRMITAITSPTVNSYKRLVPGFEAPVYIAWDYGNRSALIRVPAYSLKSKKRIRIEYRSPDPSSNPYLTFVAMLAAGIEGIKKKLEPPEPINKNLYKLSTEEREKLGVKMLPGSLEEALAEFKKADFLREALGQHIYNTLIEMKTKEWEDYKNSVENPYTREVTEWEWKRYLFL